MCWQPCQIFSVLCKIWKKCIENYWKYLLAVMQNLDSYQLLLLMLTQLLLWDRWMIHVLSEVRLWHSSGLLNVNILNWLIIYGKYVMWCPRLRKREREGNKITTRLSIIISRGWEFKTGHPYTPKISRHLWLSAA